MFLHVCRLGIGRSFTGIFAMRLLICSLKLFRDTFIQHNSIKKE